jgi:hypothetical protein
MMILPFACTASARISPSITSIFWSNTVSSVPSAFKREPVLIGSPLGGLPPAKILPSGCSAMA